MNFSNNAKLLLESLLLVCYLLIGAFIFQALEKKNEQREKMETEGSCYSWHLSENVKGTHI